MPKDSQNKSSKTETTGGDKTRKRDRLASENKLLDAAEEIFAKHGFDGATTRMISAKAGVNETLISRYFEGKMGLLLALIERHANSDSVHEKLNYPPHDNALDEIVAYAKSKYRNDGKKNFDIFRIILSQAIIDPKFAKRFREAVPIFQEPELLERLQALKAKGKIRAEVDLHDVVKNLLIYILGNIIAQRILLATPLEDVIDSFEKTLRAQGISLVP